jgi:hypothetical protein
MTKEEAINKIKDRRFWDSLNLTEKEALQLLISELRETKDESISKAIIRVISDVAGGYPFEKHGITKKEALAYLEKHKAKERLDRMAPIYNDKESFESALEKAWKYYNESASRTVDSFEDDYIECVFSKGFREGFLYKEKQKEQPTNEEMLRMFHLEYEKGVADTIAKYEQEEQKPKTWSGKDRINYEVIKNHVESDGWATAEQIDWYRALSPNTITTEWNERLLSTVIGLIHLNIKKGSKIATTLTPSGYISKEDLIKRLKSFRPPEYCENCKLKRSVESWKPTNEQMDALKHCGFGCYVYGDGPALRSLYNDLKKLM